MVSLQIYIYKKQIEDSIIYNPHAAWEYTTTLQSHRDITYTVNM